MRTNEYELGIYEVVNENDTECVSVVMTGSFDECLEAMKSETIDKDKQFFNIAALDEEGGIDGESWDYNSDGWEIEKNKFWEYFGYED